MSVRVACGLIDRLRIVCAQRKLSRELPNTQKDIIEMTLEDWLNKVEPADSWPALKVALRDMLATTNVTDLAADIHVSRSTLYRLIRRDSGPPIAVIREAIRRAVHDPVHGANA